jgi:hypothetical protein
VSIFNSQGEWVTTLCGRLPPPAPRELNLTVSTFVPNPSGPGGTLTLFLDGQVMAVWDATDNGGKVMPNGFYHLVLTPTFTDGTQVALNRGVYVDPYSQTARVQMLVEPNFIHSEGTVQISAVVEGNPVQGAGVFRIYALNGELLRSLGAVNGQAAWDLTNREGQPVASGIYLIALNVMDPKTGSPANKTAKVLVLR